jgi:hypothetical protein
LPPPIGRYLVGFEAPDQARGLPNPSSTVTVSEVSSWSASAIPASPAPEEDMAVRA